MTHRTDKRCVLVTSMNVKQNAVKTTINHQPTTQYREDKRMKLSKIAVLFFLGMAAFSSIADECVKACEDEYKECKQIAESPTAKAACEDDVTSCKAECK